MRKEIIWLLQFLVLLIVCIFLLADRRTQSTEAQAQSCVEVASMIKPCYCLWCKEGDSHYNNGHWQCNEDGLNTPKSDDGAADQGCKMRMKIVSIEDTCTWP